MKKIYAIIVTYNAMRHGWIDRCINSLRESTVPITPIVVDNCSTDGTRQHVPQFYPEAIWLPQDKNLGFGQGNNKGIKYALENNADYILLLNQDAAINNDAVSLMLKESDDSSLCSPLHLNGNGSDFDYNFQKYSLPQKEIAKDLLINKVLAHKYETGEICAACWFMPISIIKRIGGFNPVFSQYGEDNNYYNRLVYHNVKTILVPRAKMYHDRQCQGDMQIFYKKRLRRALTLIAYDINLTPSACIKKMFGQMLSCYKNDFIHRHYLPGHCTYELIKLLFNICSIRNSRKKERTITNNWL